MSRDILDIMESKLTKFFNKDKCTKTDCQKLNEYLRHHLVNCVAEMSQKHIKFYINTLKDVVNEDLFYNEEWKEYEFKDDEQQKRMEELHRNLRLLLNDIRDLCDIDL